MLQFSLCNTTVVSADLFSDNELGSKINIDMISSQICILLILIRPLNSFQTF